MKIEKYKYTMNLIGCFLKDNNIDYGSYSIKDYCTDATVGYLDYFKTRCNITVIPSLAKYGQSEDELIVSIISDNCYLEHRAKYFYMIGTDFKALLSDKSDFTDEEIKRLKLHHNYFNYEDFESVEDFTNQFMAHVYNNKYNLLATFIPKTITKK